MTLVLHHSKASGTAQMILMGIANHQGDGGAWPAISTLAKYGKVSERRAQQIIRELELLGELQIVNNGGGKTETGATNLYQVTLCCPSDCDGTMNHKMGQGVKFSASRGEISDTQGVKPVSPKPVILNHQLNLINDHFEEFWLAYPRKVAKKVAKRAWELLSGSDRVKALDGAVRLSNDPNLPEERYVPHPASWLRAERWNDGPLPERAFTAEELRAKELEKAARRREQEVARSQAFVAEQEEIARRVAESPADRCVHGRVLAACMPCIKSGKVG